MPMSALTRPHPICSGACSHPQRFSWAVLACSPSQAVQKFLESWGLPGRLWRRSLPVSACWCSSCCFTC